MLTVISVHNWQYKWEKTLKDPNNLFFSTSIVNIAPYVLERIDFELSRIPWGSRRNPQRLQKKLPSRYQKMLELIFDIASSDNIEAKILQIAAPSSIKYLKKFAKQPKQAQQPQQNLKTIRYHLIEIINVYNSAVFVIAAKRLTLQLMNEKHSPNYVIPWLARALLSRYPEEFIKNAAGESFSQSFAELYKIQIHDSIRKSRCISEQREPAYRDMLVAVCDTLKPLSGQSLQDYCDALFQDRRRWRTDLHFLYKSYCDLLIKHNQKIDNLLHKKVKESQKALRSKIPTVMANNLKLLVREMVRIVILNIIIKCLLDEYQDIQGIHNLSKTPYPSEVSAVIKAAIYGQEQSPISFSYTAAKSQIWAFARSLSCQLINLFFKPIIQKEVDRLAALSANLIMAEAHENNSQKITCRTSTLERVLSRFDSLTSFKKYIKALIRTIILKLRTSLHRLSESKDLSQFTNAFQEEHLNLLHEELSKKVIVSRFPATISSKYAKSMFNKLFARFSIQKKRNWRVFFLLGDIDCKSRVLRIGEVTIYDARQWYFGETEAFDLDYDPKAAVGENFKTLYFSYETWKGESRDIELRRNSARAYVEVKATDAYTAARNAEILLNQVLDSLVFTFSSRNKVAGIKPQLPRAVEVTDLQLGNASYQLSSRKISKMLEIDRENDKIIEYYDKLASTNKIQFKDPIMRALSLFRSGYWDISTSSQFRNYWIALEQLIDSVAKTKPLAKAKIIDIITDRVPRLTITWQRARDNYSINGMLGSVKMEIQNNHQLYVQLSRNPKLSKWKDDPVAIIENTQYLSRRIKNEHIKSNLQELQELFTGKKRRRLRNRVVALRDEEELRIGILYAMRNRLTHEGITYFEAEKIYIHSMETLLIDVLEAFLSHIDAENLDDLITRHNRPLDIRVRK